MPTIEYYGQRAWRVGLNGKWVEICHFKCLVFLDSQPSNGDLRDKVITILQAEEYTKDFSVRNAIKSYLYHQTRTYVHRLMSVLSFNFIV